VCALDSVLWFDAPHDVLLGWRHGEWQQAMLRAILWRALVDQTDGVYDEALSAVTAST